MADAVAELRTSAADFANLCHIAQLYQETNLSAIAAHLAEGLLLLIAEGRCTISLSSRIPTVLLVEDADQLRKMISSMLRAGGYEVLEAADGTEALAVFARESDAIDLILTDVVMPRMNGTELADRLWLLRRECPVVFMSGYVDNCVVESVMRGGGSFLRKPFTAQTLVAFVGRCLGQVTERAGTASSRPE